MRPLAPSQEPLLVNISPWPRTHTCLLLVTERRANPLAANGPITPQCALQPAATLYAFCYLPTPSGSPAAPVSLSTRPPQPTPTIRSPDPPCRRSEASSIEHAHARRRTVVMPHPDTLTITFCHMRRHPPSHSHFPFSYRSLYVYSTDPPSTSKAESRCPGSEEVDTTYS